MKKMPLEQKLTTSRLVMGHPAMIQSVIGSVNVERIKNYEDAISQ